jgi:FMN phosphatase YigB (HAD superfamily)
MPLTLEQYADYLDTRHDLSWPAPPSVEPPRAKPFLVPLPEVRAVTWNVYGTLLAVAGGELLFEHPQQFMMDVALDKTIQEFKMWQAMTRKPGQPADYMKQIYGNVLSEMQFLPTGAEKHPEVASDKIWETILKKLLHNEYTFDTGFYGSLDDYSRKVAYFFHASLQGCTGYPGVAEALGHVQRTLGVQGLLANGQCFTPVQLARALKERNGGAKLSDLVPEDLRVLSYEVRAKKPSERIVREMVARLKGRGIEAAEVLHVGSSVTQDVALAKRFGMKTALFAGDKATLQATPEQLKQPQTRPDVLLTELPQIAEIVRGP